MDQITLFHNQLLDLSEKEWDIKSQHQGPVADTFFQSYSFNFYWWLCLLLHNNSPNMNFIFFVAISGSEYYI